MQNKTIRILYIKIMINQCARFNLQVIIFDVFGWKDKSWKTSTNPPYYFFHWIFISILNVPQPNLFNWIYSSPENVILDGWNVGCKFTSTFSTYFLNGY